MDNYTVSFNASASSASRSTGGFQYPVPRRVTASTPASRSPKSGQFKIKMTVPAPTKGK